MKTAEGVLRTTAQVLKATEEVSLAIQDLAEALPRPIKRVSELSFQSAIEYFVEARPETPKVTRGAIFRQQHPQGHLITQVFLDSENHVFYQGRTPYGRRLLAKRLDPELDESFGNTNLILVK